MFEKRVLGCYMRETLNAYLQLNDGAHSVQAHAFQLLHADSDIHESELAYWSDAVRYKRKELVADYERNIGLEEGLDLTSRPNSQE